MNSPEGASLRPKEWEVEPQERLESPFAARGGSSLREECGLDWPSGSPCGKIRNRIGIALDRNRYEPQ